MEFWINKIYIIKQNKLKKYLMKIKIDQLRIVKNVKNI
jgi:hypothetical protein